MSGQACCIDALGGVLTMEEGEYRPGGCLLAGRRGGAVTAIAAGSGCRGGGGGPRVSPELADKGEVLPRPAGVDG